MGKQWKQWQTFYFGGASKSLQMVTAAMKLRYLLLGRKAMTNLDSILRSRDVTLPTNVHLVKALVFPVVMYGLWEFDYKESWVLKNWFFWNVVLEKTLESPLECKIKPVHLKGNHSWVFIGRTDPEAETPILWPPDAKNSHWKRPWCWERWRQEEKGTIEDEMIGWHHRFNGHEFVQPPRAWTTGKPGVLSAIGSQSDWTTTNNFIYHIIIYTCSLFI